jgi:hypothetical protein
LLSLLACAGQAGPSGQLSLIRLTPEAPGANCTLGGTRVSVGPDTNGDGVLQDGEVTSLSFVCNGQTGPSGQPSLIRLTPEAPGANCVFGGTLVAVGLDSNGDGVLQDGEVTSTTYVCNGVNSVPPTVPLGLTAQGDLGVIRLRWAPSVGAGLTGYNVYRSTDVTGWTLLNLTPLASTSFDDPIPSPAGDGVLYRYRVTAVGPGESAPSAVAQTIHGTRLPAHSTSGFITSAPSSPYVAEGSVVIDGGDLVVSAGTKLYVIDSAILDLERWSATTGTLVVNGLLRVLATPAAYATFTAHKVGGTLADNEGFSFRFDGAVSYDPVDGSGTLLQNSRITNLASGNGNGGFWIMASAPRLFNLNVSSNSAVGGSYIFLFGGAGPIIQNCHFERLTLVVAADLRGTSFKTDHVRFRGGYYAIEFANLTSPGVQAGQIELNDFDGTKEAYMFNVAVADPVPLTNNAWSGGAGAPPLPATLITSSTTSFLFAGALAAPPAGVGPSWVP